MLLVVELTIIAVTIKKGSSLGQNVFGMILCSKVVRMLHEVFTTPFRSFCSNYLQVCPLTLNLCALRAKNNINLQNILSAEFYFSFHLATLIF